MSELDETAVETAVRAGYASWMLSPWVGMESPEPFDDTEEGYQASWRCEIRAAIAAYFAAAARPTPDAEAMEREFDRELSALIAEIRQQTYDKAVPDESVKRMWTHYDAVIDLYRKAVSR